MMYRNIFEDFAEIKYVLASLSLGDNWVFTALMPSLYIPLLSVILYHHKLFSLIDDSPLFRTEVQYRFRPALSQDLLHPFAADFYH